MGFNEITGNMWDIEADAYCITTNGFVKKNGEAVMGAGCAKEAATRYPSLPAVLGIHIKLRGNLVWLYEVTPPLLMFPVKHNWYEKADLELIVKSAVDLMKWVDGKQWQKVLLPRPGCGNGKLKWDDVKIVLEPILDNRIWIVSK
jgi:hypothetical protein